ncbi:MAG: glucoamylase family protein [Candidatus Omnitrophota bacterium]|nr:glucoamylase family protein [Candidatus Omnitrophota bacterium]
MEAAPVYDVLATEESLLRASEYVVVDDFNSGEDLKNRFGHTWEILTQGDARAVGKISNQDARAEARGHSLKLHLDIPAHQSVQVRTHFGDLDVSHAAYLVMKVRAEFQDLGNLGVSAEGPLEQYFDGQFELWIEDKNGRKSAQDITALCIAAHEKWNDVIIPVSLFRGLDLDRLSAMQLNVTSNAKRTRGKLWIDEVAFFGPAHLEFESRRDNLVGFPRKEADPDRLQWILEKAKQPSFGKVFLREIARDTWKYFKNARNRNTHLVVDHVRLGTAPLAADYTSITNIAMDIMGTIAAMDLGFIERKEAVKSIQNTFKTLEKLERWKGFFYNYYNTTTLKPSPKFISSVDSGWLAASLVVVRQAFERELGRQASEFLEAFDFSEFLDPENNQLAIGFDEDKGDLTPHHYGLLASEARVAYLLAIGKGDLSSNVWWFIYRTPPASWAWQNQKPKGEYVTQDGIEYFQGYYTYNKRRFLPSWGGSLFEFLMPTLVLLEREMSPEGLGMNNRIVTEIHREYALQKKKYPLWGLSPASTGDGRGWQYSEYGVRDLAVKGYPDSGVVTPHVSFLALDSLPEEALKNIQDFMDFNMYGDYGLYDSINLRQQRVNPQYLALDQGMTLIAIANYLKGGSIQERFHADPIGKKAAEIIGKESFFTR